MTTTAKNYETQLKENKANPPEIIVLVWSNYYLECPCYPK